MRKDPMLVDIDDVFYWLFLSCLIYIKKKYPKEECHLQSMLYEIEFMMNYISNTNHKNERLVQIREEIYSQFI